MAEGTPAGSIEWPLENEIRWVTATFSNGPTHRVMLHAKIGMLFDNHGLFDSEAVSVEAQMMEPGGFCGCHLLALWWQSVLVWGKCFYKVPDAQEQRKIVVHLTNEKKTEIVVVTMDGEPLAVQFFLRMVKAVDPTAKIGF